MQDHDIEQLISRYRPAGPPPELRARALMPGDPRVWPWVAAAAALFIVTVASGRATEHLIARTAVMAAPGINVRAAEDLAQMMGGGHEALRSAALLLAEQQWRAEQAALDFTASTPPGVTP